jgi:hypothetical protein
MPGLWPTGYNSLDVRPITHSFIDKVTNYWSYTSTSPYEFMAFTGNFLSFFLYEKINYFILHLKQINAVNYIT